MLFGREQFTVATEMNGEMIDKLYAKELIPTPIAEFESLSDEEKKLHKPYPFDPHTYEAAPASSATRTLRWRCATGRCCTPTSSVPRTTRRKSLPYWPGRTSGSVPTNTVRRNSWPTPPACRTALSRPWQSSREPIPHTEFPTDTRSSTWTSAALDIQADIMSNSARRMAETATTS